ncbi:hypothetical protein ACSBLW_16495 [Thioclava sp. FR2]|uniref:hypothetical protein n=1 Tax=Thioclava sp. FR2 TaxID=3445780 RepID=UPI003EBC62A4
MGLSAACVYQANLDAVSGALWRGDVVTILDHLAIPNSMVTEDAALIIASVDEMTITVTEFREQMIAMGADSYSRTCIAARFINGRGDMIVGIHETRITCDGEPVCPSYLNRMTLLHRHDRWKGVVIEAETSNRDITILSPDLAEEQRRELARLGISLGRS